MPETPNWLPSMVCVSPWTEETFQVLYKIFERDFKKTDLSYDGYRIWFFPEMSKGYEKIFWHLTHKNDKDTKEPTEPDLRRSERLPWARCMIENCTKTEILHWDYEEDDRDINTYIWLKDHDYLLIMKKYKDGQRRLLTSYYIDYPNYRRKLEKKYKARIQ